MRIVTIPCLSDNYAYLLIDDRSRAVVVDPSEAAPVLAAVEDAGVELEAIWLTHHHWDHVGGVEELVARFGSLEVLGSEYDRGKGRIPRQTRGLREGDELSFDGQPVTILEIPGHTLGAIAYVVDGRVFSGDTLFLAGCGRVFEGTMPMMQSSLAKLRGLPEETEIYCGHEYTVANLRFAGTIEPDSDAIKQRLAWAQQRRKQGEPTVPGTLADELGTNPFLRWDSPAVQAGLQRLSGQRVSEPAEVFGAARRAKDSF